MKFSSYLTGNTLQHATKIKELILFKGKKSLFTVRTTGNTKRTVWTEYWVSVC
jgi:hypothetical protein